MTEISKEQLEAWKALGEKATPGEWRRIGDVVHVTHWDEGVPLRHRVIRFSIAPDASVHDQNFVAESRTGWPACIALAEMWQTIAEDLRTSHLDDEGALVDSEIMTDGGLSALEDAAAALLAAGRIRRTDPNKDKYVWVNP